MIAVLQKSVFLLSLERRAVAAEHGGKLAVLRVRDLIALINR